MILLTTASFIATVFAIVGFVVGWFTGKHFGSDKHDPRI